MSIQFGKINNNIFVNSTATYENGIVSISSPENAEKVNFYAPSNANNSDLYEINGKQVILSNILNNNPEITWVKGAPISAVYDSQNNKLFISSINGENSLFSNLFRNANAEVVENKIVINSVKEAVDLFNFYSPKAYSANDIYEVNGQVYDVVDLQGNKLESGWNSDVPVSLVLNENKLWYSSNGSDTKLPSDLSPLCPNFRVERNGGKVKISADKIQLNSYTNMVSGGVWAWGKTRPTKPTGENTKLWTRAELITTGKPYDGLYLGDVTPSDAVTETLIYLPENDGGSVKLVPFIVLSTDYLGGVYVMREPLSESMKATWGGSHYYPGNPVDSFLSATYLNSILDKSISDALLTCSVPVQAKSSMTVETMDRKCWVPSYGELYSATFNDGTKMPYFNSTNRIAYINGGKVKGAYWTRTREKGGSPYSVDTSGGMSNAYGWSDTIYIRPAFVLPKDFQIQQRPDGSYTVYNDYGLMTLKDIKVSDSSSVTKIHVRENSGVYIFDYVSSNYNDSDRGCLFREEALAGMVGTSVTYPSGGAGQGASNWEAALPSSLRNLISEVTIKYKNATSVQETTARAFVPSIDEMYGTETNYGTGTQWNMMKVSANRIRHYNGSPISYWLRDAASSTKVNYMYTSGNYNSDGVNSQKYCVPAFTLPLTAPIRALADGTYDLVPEDPALSAQSISTLAEEEEVPLEIELDWPESDPLIARQWVYNEKGVYQTMLLGGVASTEDAPAYRPVLSENTWEQIAQACADRDPILDSWLVGDEKDEVINGETLTFVIVGKDHDDLADGSGKAPLTFGMKNLMAETRKMNSSNTNSGSFAGSAMYSWLSGTIYPNLPTELKDAIKAVNKKTSSGGSSSAIRTDAMYLWLFAEIEVFGSTTNSFVGEGTQYPYFATLAERIKRLSNGAGAASYWWERSPRRNSSGYFCYVDTSGSANYAAASNSNGVCFGFCI